MEIPSQQPVRQHQTVLPTLVVATGNRGKAVEMADLLRECGFNIKLLEEVTTCDYDVEETGATYAENAALKARTCAAATGFVCIADDAGLEIDALGGTPGLHSRRYLGEHVPFDAKMRHILDLMADVPDAERACRFHCAVAIARPGAMVATCEGVCEGVIAREMRGSHGFGYDPIFMLPSLGRHMAELPPAEKHAISHRGIAMACARAALQAIAVSDAGR